jgi:protoheme IX farnesyltransferase
MLKTYYMLTKPGIILGNLITTAAGFALASKGHFDIVLFLVTMLGLGFVIASAGVFNNYTDRSSDAKMQRTKNRPLVLGTISLNNTLYFASIMGIIGISVLYYYTNILTVFVAVIGFFVYLVLYAFTKYRSYYGTLVGSVAGAVPPVVGYCAVTDRFDTGAFLLFMIVVLWQMPHFFAIAIYRYDDYKKASIPVLPVARGILPTKIQMVAYIIAFILVACLLTVTGYTGNLYLIVALILGCTWLALCVNGFTVQKQYDKKWARSMFVYSLVVIMGLCLTMSLDVN